MRALGLALAFLVLLLTPAAAQTAAPAAALAPTRAELESLIGVLENDAERAKLVRQLQLIVEAQKGVGAAPQAPVAGLPWAAMDSLAIRINRYSMDFWEALDLDKGRQRISNWVRRLVTDPLLRGQRKP